MTTSKRSWTVLRGPLIVMGFTVSCTIGAMWYAYSEPIESKRVMREGVHRDKERLKRKREEREQAAAAAAVADQVR